MSAPKVTVRSVPASPGVRGHQIEVVMALGTAALSRLLGELHRRRTHVEDLRYAEQPTCAVLTLTVVSDAPCARLLVRRLDRLVDTVEVRLLPAARPSAGADPQLLPQETQPVLAEDGADVGLRPASIDELVRHER